MSTENLIYLITGANRGIGKGLTSSLLLRPHTTVIACVRSVENSLPVLDALPKASSSKLILVKVDLASPTDPATAISELTSAHGITHIDTVIANAGIAHSHSPVAAISTEPLLDHFSVNAIAPILLFQAASPLLKASPTKTPKFLAISTMIGSIATQENMTSGSYTAYGASKAALNWMVKRIHVEEKWLCAYVSHPGLVVTDMSLSIMGTEEQAKRMGGITVEQSAEGLLKVLDGATREETGGVFKSWDGSVVPW